MSFEDLEKEIYKLSIMNCTVCKKDFVEKLELLQPVKEGQGVLCYCPFCTFPVIAKFKRFK